MVEDDKRLQTVLGDFANFLRERESALPKH